MTSPYSVVPDNNRLNEVLSSLDDLGELSVVNRARSIQGTYPKEVVTCRLRSGREIQLFCKYSAGYSHNAHGHRAGIELEAKVYRNVLPFVKLSTPKVFGVFEFPDTKETWLILEYLTGSVRVRKAPYPIAMILAASWVGQFHACTKGFDRKNANSSFLIPYDFAYYSGWVDRTRQKVHNLGLDLPWLEALCERFPEVITVFSSMPPDIIHGEYYPKNILFRDSQVYPVDWESTTIAAGVIDLACLIDGWPESTVNDCLAAYQTARWPAGSPDEFNRAFIAAQLYVNFRWLGDDPKTPLAIWRLSNLLDGAKRLGLV